MPDVAEPLAFRFGDFLLDRPAGVLLRLRPDGQTSRVPLGGRAFRILCLLVERRGAIVTRQEIMDTVWPDVVVEENNLSVQLSNLRRALDAGRDGGSCIQTLPGRGYRFLPTVGEGQKRPVEHDPVQATPDRPTRLAPVANPNTPASREAANSGLAAELSVAGFRTPRHRRATWVIAGACFGLAMLLVLILRPRSEAPIAGVAGVPANPPAAIAQATPLPLERPRLTLAILPFDRLGDVDEHTVNAIVDDLMTELSRYAGLHLTARASAFAYKGKPIDIAATGRDLAVRFALAGSVRRLHGGLVVNAQLIVTETGEQVWAERFTIEPDGADDAADNIVRRIAFLVQQQVFEAESARSLRERPNNPDATDALVRAYALYNMPPTPQKHAQLVALYERAVALDPSSAPALAGLAETLLDSLPAVSSDDPAAPFKLRRAEELLNRADLINPNELRLLVARPYLLVRQERCPEAMQAARRAIEVHPVLSGPYQWLGMCLLREGRAAEAVQQFEQAIRTNPRTPQIDNRYRLMGMALLWLGRYDEAVSWLHRALAVNPSLHPQTRGTLHASVAAAQALSGDLEAARRSVAEASRQWPPLTALGYLPFKSTNPNAAMRSAQIRDGLRIAGMRDHAEEDADPGLPADDILHADYEAVTPVGVPGAQTIRTPELATLLEARRPLVLDTTYWGGSIPGAIALWGSGIGGSVLDEYQDRLRRKLHRLTAGNSGVPIVTVGWNAERYQGRNLALRLAALGYTDVYWYRGGREAWVAAGLPTAEVTLQDW